MTTEGPSQGRRLTKERYLSTYSKGGLSSQREPYPDQPGTFDSDWQKDSLLLMAEKVCDGLQARADLPEETRSVLCRLITQFIGAAELYYTTGVNKLSITGVPGLRESFASEGLLSERQPRAAERREIIRNISIEWARLMSLVGSAQLLGASDPALRMLRAAFLVARNDLQLGSQDWAGLDFVVLPHFGRHFELVSFNYHAAIFVLGVPVGSLYCPWEWPLIWHEMAGIYVRLHADHTDSVIKRLAEQLSEQVQNEALWAAWVASYGADLNQLPKANGHLTKAVLQNWAEELVEDAVGLLCLGEVMFFSLEAALSSAYAQAEQPGGQRPGSLELLPGMFDERHPPAELRLAFAESLLRQRELGGADDPEAPLGIGALAALVWAGREQIVAHSFGLDQEAEIDAALFNMQGASPFSAWRALGIDPETPSIDASHALGVRRLVAGATLAFHTRIATGKQIRSAVYGSPNGPQPTAAGALDGEQLLQNGFSRSDELFFSNRSCDGHNLKFTLRGKCLFHDATVTDLPVTLFHP